MIDLKGRLVVGFCGRRQVGKDTAAHMLSDNLWTIGLKPARSSVFFGVADGMKLEVARIFGCDLDTINRVKLNDLGRWILEQVGTNYFCRSDFINYIDSRILDCKPPSLILITSVRKIDEAEHIQKRHKGIIVRVRGANDASATTLPSETELEKIKADFIVNNDGTFGMLNAAMKDTAKLILEHNIVKPICIFHQKP